MIKPAEQFFGLSLFVGVEVACLAALVISVLLISVCSSTEPIQISGIVISPEIQVGAASWAFVGIPCAVIGGVGVLHRIEEAVRFLFFYSCGSFALSLLIPIWFVSSKSLCDFVVHPDLQSQGAAFVCGFADTILFVWGLILTGIQAFMLYIIWSAAEDIHKNPFPELRKWRQAVDQSHIPVIEDSPTPEALAMASLGLAQGGSCIDPALGLMPVTMPPSRPPTVPGAVPTAAPMAVPTAAPMPPASSPQLASGPIRRQHRTPVSELLSAAANAGQPFQFGPAQASGVGQVSNRFEDFGVPQSFAPSSPTGVRLNSSAPPPPPPPPPVASTFR